MLHTIFKERSTTLPKALLTAGLLGAAALSTLGAGAAHAVGPAPLPEWGTFSNGVLGGQFFYSGGDLTVTDVGSDSGFLSSIYLASPGFSPTKLSFLFTDNSFATAVFTPIQLGALGIVAGDELVFAIIPDSPNPGDIPLPTLPALPDASTFFSGATTRNADGLYHAAVYTGSGANNGQFIMGFEDILGGGDEDFNDAAFRATSGVDNVPGDTVPGPLPLLGVGAAFGLSRKLRNRIKLVSSKA